VRFNDPGVVAREYASEERFLARRVAFREYVQGPNAEDLAIAAVREVVPCSVLEVGCGTGDFGARLRDELGVDVVAVDLSPRMVALARERGLDARVGDVQELDFGEASFDCAVANWVLHHVPDLDRGLTELVRVLRPGGRLVAATFGEDHVRELWRWLGYEKAAALDFNRRNGAKALYRHFAEVGRRDTDAVVVFPDREAVRSFVASTIVGAHLADSIPEHEGVFRARSRQSVFVADKAS
jgi:SAM-dependent methyltransferase